MQCRTDCGACCIAISIRQPYYGMPAGKPAGIRCTHLATDMSCTLFGDKRRPDLCDAFAPERVFCGDNREQALMRLSHLEHHTLPDVSNAAAGRLA
jgi:hypothetical protein